VDAVFAIDFVHAMVYGAGIILLAQAGTIAMYGPSIARAVRAKRELRRLRTDIDVTLDRALSTWQMPRDHHKALIAARTILDAVRAASRPDTGEAARGTVESAARADSPGGHDNFVRSLSPAELTAAATHARGTLRIDEAVLRSSQQHLAPELNDLALLLLRMGHLAAAEPVMRQALAIAEGTFNAADPTLPIYLGNLTAILDAAARSLEPERLRHLAEELSKASSGDTFAGRRQSVQDTNIDQRPLVREQGERG
jgi:hypothetical protein